MLILGLLLVVASGAAAAVLIAYNSGGTAETVTAFGRDIGDFTLMQAFVAGIVVALVFLLGMMMVLMAGRRGRENRARYREARREAKAAAAERDELAEQLRRDDEVRANEQTTVTQPVAQPAAQPTSQPTGTAAPAPAGTTESGRHSAHQQPVITNIRPGQSPSR